MTKRTGLLILALALAGGCVQVETHVLYHEDGAATITERLNLSKRVLDMASGDKSASHVSEFLTKPAALRRMRHMGDGISLVRHEVRDGEKGSRESVTVFRIPDLNNFCYVSPWFAYADYPWKNAVKWNIVPMYKSRPYHQGSAGCISVELQRIKLKETPEGEAIRKPDADTPLDQQVYREIGPVFRDVLRDLQLKLTFEAYCPVYYKLNSRGQRARAKSVDILNVSDKQLDKYGYNFFENEEIMLDLVRYELGSADIADHVKGYGANLTLPVFTPLGSEHMWWTGGQNIHFRPSKPLFDRFFAGKKLDFSAWQESPPEKRVLADFRKIGYHPAPGADGKAARK
jgi:hypothetical protein